MRELVFTIFSLVLMNAHAGNPCLPSEIYGELTGMNFVGKKAIPVKKWDKLPNSLSIHDGEYGRLKFKSGDLMEFTYIGKDLKGRSYSKTLKENIGRDHIANVELMKWFDQSQNFNGGKLQIKLYENKEVICTHNMEIIGGD